MVLRLLRRANALIAAILPGFALRTRACVCVYPALWWDRDGVGARVAAWEGGVFCRGRVEVSK